MQFDVLEVLDSIDGCESDVSTEGLAIKSDRSNEKAMIVEMVTPLATVSTSRTTKQLSQDKSTKARRRVGLVPYSTDLQRRKRSELKELRQEAHHLNAQFVQLQQQRHNRIATATWKGSNGWQSLTAIQYEERQRAEHCNRQLKAIMADMQKVFASFNRLLGKCDALQGQEFVFRLKPKVERPVIRLSFIDAILADLASSLDSLRLDAGKMFPMSRDDQVITCRSENKRHATTGHCVAETSTITPLACTMKDAGDILWPFICGDVDKCFASVNKRAHNALEMTSVVACREGLLHIDGVNIHRRYDEDHRVVVVGATTWVLPNGGLQFEDRVWTVITPSPTDPLHACVVQTRYQLQVKATSAAFVLPADLDYAQEAVLSSIGNELRNAMQSLQTALLDEVELRLCQFEQHRNNTNISVC